MQSKELNEITKKELVQAYCDEKMSQGEYNKMIAFFFKTEDERSCYRKKN